MSKNNFKYLVCIAILTRVFSRDLKDDTLVAISCMELVGQSGLPSAVVVVLVRIITVCSNVPRRRKVLESQPVELLLRTREKFVHMKEGEISIFRVFRSFMVPGCLVVVMKICDQS